jgi:hypothetical protein
VNLFDAELGICADPVIAADSRWLLCDLDRCPDGPWVIAAAGRVREEVAGEHSLTFTVEGMAETTCAVRVRLPDKPKTAVNLDGNSAWSWDAGSNTALIRFANWPAGARVEIRW